MANRKTADSGANNVEAKITTVRQLQSDYSYKRDRAQTMTFAKMQEILQRNPTRNANKTFT